VFPVQKRDVCRGGNIWNSQSDAAGLPLKAWKASFQDALINLT